MGRDEARDAELREVLSLLEKATAFDLSTAEHKDDGLHDCPLCDGGGAVEGTTYTNFDRVATGVQFFGVGNEHEHLERAVLAAYHFLRKHGESLASRPQAGTVETGCPACGRNWGEHRSGYSASRCPMKKPPTPPGDSEDAARLDWLESQFGDGVHVEGCHSGAWSERNLARCATVFYGNKEARATTIREAIDAARAAQEANNG